MDKAIVLLEPDGTETVLAAAPTWKAMSALLGGPVDLVKVVDRVEDGRLVYTALFVHEEGLLLDLPRNEVATALYQRNVRLQFPSAANPFAEAAAAWRRMISPKSTRCSARRNGP